MSSQIMTMHRVETIQTSFRVERLRKLRTTQSILSDLLNASEKEEQTEAYRKSLMLVSSEISRLTAAA